MATGSTAKTGARAGTPAPKHSDVVERAVLMLGADDRQAGLDAIAEHPLMYPYGAEKGLDVPVGFCERNRAAI